MAGALMTPEEFDATENWDDNYRYELIGGRLIVTPPPLPGERDPNGELEHLLRQYKEHHPKGAALDKTLYEQTVRTHTSRRRADRVIWAGLGRGPTRRDPPTVVVEFVSASHRDRHRDYVEKRQEYQAVGVAEYWVIDRFRRRMTVVRNHEAGAEELSVQEHDIYRTPLLPGFELPLSRLFRAADEAESLDED
jgi:Uma2 family endonuclease